MDSVKNVSRLPGHRLPTYYGRRSGSSHIYSCHAACFAAPPRRPISGRRVVFCSPGLRDREKRTGMALERFNFISEVGCLLNNVIT